MDRLTDLRATGNLLNRNSKPFSEGRRTKELSDPESTLRLASKDKCVIMHQSLCDTDRDGSVLRYRPGDEDIETGLSIIYQITFFSQQNTTASLLELYVNDSMQTVYACGGGGGTVSVNTTSAPSAHRPHWRPLFVNCHFRHRRTHAQFALSH